MGERVLVTGGSGYIAGWCIAELLTRGYDVRATVRGPGKEQAVTDAVPAAAGPASVTACSLPGPRTVARTS